MRVVHFIGFRGDEYWSAVKIWGRPHIVHMGWDKRAQRDIGEDDIVVFAIGDEKQPLRAFNYPDIIEGRLVMAVNSLAKRKHAIKQLLVKLETPMTMSMYLTPADLYRDAMKQRNEAAKLLREILES